MIRISLPFTLCDALIASELLIMSPVRLILRKSLTQLFSLQLKRNKRGRMIQKKSKFSSWTCRRKKNLFLFPYFLEKFILKEILFESRDPTICLHFKKRTLFKIQDHLLAVFFLAIGCKSRRDRNWERKQLSHTHAFTLSLFFGSHFFCNTLFLYLSLMHTFICLLVLNLLFHCTSKEALGS